MHTGGPSRRTVFVILLLCAMGWSFCTVLIHARSLARNAADLPALAERHAAVLAGTAPAPEQYRVLSHLLLEGLMAGAAGLGLDEVAASGFLVFRLLQNTALFLLAAVYYRRLGLGTAGALLGMSLLGWAITRTVDAQDFAFSAYTEVGCYLAAGWCILAGRVPWTVPLAALAALNRETSVLIPVMVLAAGTVRASGDPGDRTPLWWAVAALGAYGVVTVGLHLAYAAPVVSPMPRFAVVRALAHGDAWFHLFSVLGVLPLLAYSSFHRWPLLLRRLSWGLVPVWILAVLTVAPAFESRLFLVPQALVFVPGALLCARPLRDEAA